MPEKTPPFALTIEAPRFVGLLDCRLHTPVRFRIENFSAGALRCTLTVSSAEGIVVPFERELCVEGEEMLSVPDLFSPARLAEGGVRRVTLSATLRCGGEKVCAEQTFTALPAGYWEGLEGDAMRLAAFSDPYSEECGRTLAIARELEKRRGGALAGYGVGSDARRALSAVFSAMRVCARAEMQPFNAGAPVCASNEGFSDASRSVNALGAGLMACALLEAAGFNPVLAVGKRRAAVGVWLHDSHLLAPAEGAEDVAAYLGGAAENLVFLDAEDLFPARKISFARSKARFFEGMQAGEYRVFVDIRRCRAAGYAPPPPAMSGGEMPHGLPHRASKWESELVDASARNPLLNFSGKNALRLICTDADGLLNALGERRAMRLAACNAEGGRELEFAALARDEIAVSAGEKEMRALLSKMLRDDREAEEETGAGLLHLAFGLLKYPHEGKTQSAPVALLPVTLVRSGGDFLLRAREGLFFNPAFLQFREEAAPPASVGEAYAAVRAAVEGKAGHGLEEAVHLALFSFRGRVIWNDLKRNLPEFMKNKLVRSLLSGRAEEGLFSCSAPVRPPRPLFFTDASQDEALALAERGASFVLHGPPGTGKSQTIANLIANAVRRGKRVLFVAEKQAALEVVWRRLERAGLGDFCLQLPVRADRAEVARKLLHTLSLAEEGATMSATEALISVEEPPMSAISEPPVCGAEAPMSAIEETDALERELEEPIAALHTRGRLGTPYDAILGALREGDAPALAGGTPTFYGALSEEELAGYRHTLVSAAVAAKECGALGGMPFGRVELPAYSERAREGALLASETLLAASAHLERMLSLFLSLYGQRMPVRTAARLSAAAGLAGRLMKGADAVYFEGVTAEEVRAFCEQNARLDARLAFHFRTFRALPRTDGEALRHAREGGAWKFDRALRTAARRLARLAIRPLDEKDMPKYLQTLSDIFEASQQLSASPYARHIAGGDGRLSQKKRGEFWAGLNSLNALCGEVFPAFDALAFYGACIRARGLSEPILGGLVLAVENFFTARRAFLRATGGDEKDADGEDALSESASRAAALIDNADLFRAFCRCRETVRRLEGEGMGDITGLIARGVGERGLVAAFEKEAYRRFLEEEILARPALTRFTAAETEARVAHLRSASERAKKCAIFEARRTLIARLPRAGAEYASERAALLHAARGNGGGGVRGLLAAAPHLVAAAPCLIMSPASVAQYLPPRADLYDLVVFDEASQMTAAEAAGSIARAKAAIVAGDPNQLPPTRFFMGEGDGESVLDECLALGMPERKLRWHYRSRRESLIAFCNEAYYDGSLFTVPAPDADMGRVKLIRVGGTYDRGGKKHNRAEAEALVGEIVRRLKSPGERGQSMGVVTFSLAQREEIEKLLARALEREGLEEAAYGGEEPLFVKNLENVQGDERDVILFSVCYGPDREGKVFLNFGPLNRAGGWRRLNVAASRAREEMLVFSSLSPNQIDAEKTSSRGASDLKRFLEFAEQGGAPASRGEERGGGIGRFIARELARHGYDCRFNVGASKFKADVAIVDPRDKTRFLLAVLTDYDPTMSAKERYLVREEALRRAGWAVTRVSSVEFYMSPTREVERLKTLADGLCGRRENARLSRYAHRYRYAAEAEREDARFLLAEENAAAVCGRLKEIVSREQPISRDFLVRRLLTGYGIEGGKRVRERALALIDRCAFPRDVAAGVEYYYYSPRAIGLDRFRTEGKRALRRSAQDYSAYEIVSMVRGALEDRIALYPDDLMPLFEETFRAARADGAGAQFLLKCVKYGEERGIFARSPSERITLR